MCSGCNKNIGKDTYKFDNIDKLYYHEKCFNEAYDPSCENCGEQVNEKDEVAYNGSILHSFCLEEWKEAAIPIQEFLCNIATY